MTPIGKQLIVNMGTKPLYYLMNMDDKVYGMDLAGQLTMITVGDAIGFPNRQLAAQKAKELSATLGKLIIVYGIFKKETLITCSIEEIE